MVNVVPIRFLKEVDKSLINLQIIYQPKVINKVAWPTIEAVYTPQFNTVAMMINLMPFRPSYDKSHSYLYTSVYNLYYIAGFTALHYKKESTEDLRDI